MSLRIPAALGAALFGSALMIGGASAQYYPVTPRYLPPPGQPSYAVPPGYDEDDDVPPAGVPGTRSAVPPYPQDPATRPQAGVPGYGRPDQPPQSADAYPPPYVPQPYPAPYEAQPGPYGPPPYPVPPAVYAAPPGVYAAPPGVYAAPPSYEPPAAASRLPGVAAADPGYYPGDAAPRPPGTIGGPGAPAAGPVPSEPPPVISAPIGPPGYDPPTGSIANQHMAALPPDYRPETGEPKQLPAQLRKQLVDYRTAEPPGTLIIDTPNTFLYLVMPNGKAMRYGIGVGREGFTWSGHERISKMQEWPDWHPPAEMIQRQPYLPRFMAGGPGNPLGARALYLGNTLYRIHGTNQPSTIGSFVSSGCIRLLNEDIEDLYGRVQVGTRVVVLPGSKPTGATAQMPVTQLPAAQVR